MQDVPEFPRCGSQQEGQEEEEAEAEAEVDDEASSD